ncbi:hypothetical protein C0J52_12139 [Blattella germanica]|nr:hypothetical protein C0J52_12139 [Blattella germanica]
MVDVNWRAKNFSSFERNLLVELVLERKHIVENKKTDGASVNEKRKCWEEISTLFNASRQTENRTTKQLKELYFVLKRNARKHNNEDKMGHFQTGGGQFTPKSDSIDLKIVGALKDQFQPDENHFDSSAIIYDKVIPVVNDTDTPEASCVCIITEEPHAEIVTCQRMLQLRQMLHPPPPRYALQV